MSVMVLNIFRYFSCIFDAMLEERHRKIHPSLQRARHEETMLRLVQGDAVVPLRGVTHATVRTAKGIGSVADLLAESGPLTDAEARAIGVRVAQAVARLHETGIAHGDVKPANVVFAPGGDLWLIDFDAAGPLDAPRIRGSVERLACVASLSAESDVLSLAVMVAEMATGVVIDPGSDWDRGLLRSIGCSPDLAGDLEMILARIPSAARTAALLWRRENRLPRPPGRTSSTDPTPTVDLPGVVLAGLDPVGQAETVAAAQTSSRVMSSKVSRRTTSRASPWEAKTTGGRRTLL